MPAPSRAPVFAAAVVVTATAVGIAAMTASGELPALVRQWRGPAADEAADAGPDAGDAGADATRKKSRPQAAPLSSAQLGEPLVSGGYVTACGAPPTMKVVVKVGVKLGRPVEIDVQTDPSDPAVRECVKNAVGDMRWDPSTKTDHVTVRY